MRWVAGTQRALEGNCRIRSRAAVTGARLAPGLESSVTGLSLERVLVIMLAGLLPQVALEVALPAAGSDGADAAPASQLVAVLALGPEQAASNDYQEIPPAVNAWAHMLRRRCGG